jgi:hypothetical protein
MDTALILKQQLDSGIFIDESLALELLNKSELIKELLADFEFEILNLLNRLTELSEIPLSYKLDRVQKWLEKLASLSFCADGFSITGKSDDLLSCYNSMITSILIRMKFNDSSIISKGIEWILKYQHVERNQVNSWPGSRIQKYGGCLKPTPCYIGIVKAMIALSDYKKQSYYTPYADLENKFQIGMEYILRHQVYMRQSVDLPITKDIDKLTYPFSYKTNVIEILRLLKENNKDTDPRCNKAKEFVMSKRRMDGFWQINSSYLPKCWIQFDKTKEKGLWLTHEIEKLLNLQPADLTPIK